MTLEKFNEQKDKFHEQENAVLAVQTELNKAKNILEALENEKAEFVTRQREKLAEVGTLSADEYVEIKNKNSGLQARIEYYQALIVDLDSKLYDEQEKLSNQQKELKAIREKIVSHNAEELFEQFIQQNKETLGKLYCLLAYSGEFKPNRNLTDETEEQMILRHLTQRISDHIETNHLLDKDFSLYSEQLAGFTAKSPTALHREKFESQKPTGLIELINNL